MARRFYSRANLRKESHCEVINLRINLSDIDCIFYDFDGVMTDNRVLVEQNGLEYVYVNRSDGYGIAKLKEKGILQIIVSTEENPVVERRADKLKIPVIHGVNNKGEIILRYCSDNNIKPQRTLFMGNDLNDISAFNVVGFKAAPNDAEPEILQISDWISERKGGCGAVRDLYRMLLSNN